MATERLQKILARGGFASRRAAETLIAEGRVRVNGRVVRELGTKADPRRDKVEVDGTRVVAEQAVYAVLHKPRGVVTTMNDPEGRPSVKELLGAIGARAYPVGRLDFATSGVLLVTNDGDFAEGLMHPKKAVPKTYVVKVHGVMEANDLDRWRNGVRLEDGMTLPAQAKLLRHEGDKTWFELTIREGRNQQIRRMGEATHFPVMRLARVSFAGISGEGLKPGAWRYLTREELVTLKKEFGVPKRIVTAEEPEVGGRGRAKQGHAGRHAPRGPEARKGRGRPFDRAERGERTERPGRAGSAERGERAPAPARKGARPVDRKERGAIARGEKVARGGRRAERSEPRERKEETAPRYGGGSPGRRGYDVKEDWGGGAGRGRSSTDRDGHRDGPPGLGAAGGGGWRSRTTGSGGGPGATGSGGDYRMRGGRRAR